jgi:hypothetical protein
MEPISVVTGTIEIGKKLYELARNVKDHDIKQQLDQLGDKVRELKQPASDLEDENRELREKLRFKSDAYEFHTPFWYDKANPNRTLCPKCHAKNIDGPMGEPGQGCSVDYRKCLVCSENVEVGKTRYARSPFIPEPY